jgi:NADH-quinone oxidoreductase subunit K
MQVGNWKDHPSPREVAAAEAAVGLAILIALYRNRRTVNIDEMNTLKN